MKKLLGIVVLGLLLSGNAYSATTKFKTGSLHEGDFYWDHKKISLPPGKWETVEKWFFSLGFWTASELTLVQHSNNYLTSLYSFYLKRLFLLDAITLAILYTLRIIAGAAAITVQATGWLVAFSLFLFLIGLYQNLLNIGSVS